MFKVKAFKRALYYDLHSKYKTNVSNSHLRIVYVLQQLTVGRSLHLAHKQQVTVCESSTLRVDIVWTALAAISYLCKLLRVSLTEVHRISISNIHVSNSIIDSLEPRNEVCHQKSRFSSQDCSSLLIPLGFISSIYRKGDSASLIQGGNAMNVQYMLSCDMHCKVERSSL